MAELCPSCGAYWACEHRFGTIYGVQTVVVDEPMSEEAQDEEVRFLQAVMKQRERSPQP